MSRDCIALSEIAQGWGCELKLEQPFSETPLDACEYNVSVARMRLAPTPELDFFLTLQNCIGDVSQFIQNGLIALLNLLPEPLLIAFERGSSLFAWLQLEGIPER